MRLAAAVRDAWLNGIGASYFLPRTARYAVYRIAGVRLRTRNIRAGCFIGGPQLSVGRGCFVNQGCVFDTMAPIEIADGCHLGMQTVICTSTHDIGDPSRRAGPLRAEPVRIGVGAWLGARVTVLPGVTIGDGCVVAAGSVVTRDCKADSVYAGVPARWVRDIADDNGFDWESV